MTTASQYGLGRTSRGSVYFRDAYLALDHRHGRLRLDTALRATSPAPGGITGSLTPEDLRHAAFIDIETGPKSELSGSYAFVVGVGRFEPYYFRLRQLFHREGSSLRGLLDAFSELLDEARCLVTFNGTGFDLPYLASSFEQAGLSNPLEKLPHLDLLQVARRTYGTGLKSRRLQALEASELGIVRPRRSAYQPGEVHPLLEHNAMDVLSLVMLLPHLERRARQLSKTDSRYLVAMGRLAEQEGRLDEARDSFRAAWRLDAQGLAGGEAGVRLARLLSARGEWQQTIDLWREELQSPRLERQLRARVELSKLHERKLRDRVGALELAHQALALIEETASRRAYERSYADLTRRICRLERALSRS